MFYYIKNVIINDLPYKYLSLNQINNFVFNRKLIGGFKDII